MQTLKIDEFEDLMDIYLGFFSKDILNVALLFKEKLILIDPFTDNITYIQLPSDMPVEPIGTFDVDRDGAEEIIFKKYFVRVYPKLEIKRYSGAPPIKLKNYVYKIEENAIIIVDLRNQKKYYIPIKGYNTTDILTVTLNSRGNAIVITSKGIFLYNDKTKNIRLAYTPNSKIIKAKLFNFGKKSYAHIFLINGDREFIDLDDISKINARYIFGRYTNLLGIVVGSEDIDLDSEDEVLLVKDNEFYILDLVGNAIKILKRGTINGRYHKAIGDQNRFVIISKLYDGYEIYLINPIVEKPSPSLMKKINEIESIIRTTYLEVKSIRPLSCLGTQNWHQLLRNIKNLRSEIKKISFVEYKDKTIVKKLNELRFMADESIKIIEGLFKKYLGDPEFEIKLDKHEINLDGEDIYLTIKNYGKPFIGDLIIEIKNAYFREKINKYRKIEMHDLVIENEYAISLFIEPEELGSISLLLTFVNRAPWLAHEKKIKETVDLKAYTDIRVRYLGVLPLEFNEPTTDSENAIRLSIYSEKQRVVKVSPFIRGYYIGPLWPEGSDTINLLTGENELRFIVIPYEESIRLESITVSYDERQLHFPLNIELKFRKKPPELSVISDIIEVFSNTKKIIDLQIKNLGRQSVLIKKIKSNIKGVKIKLLKQVEIAGNEKVSIPILIKTKGAIDGNIPIQIEYRNLETDEDEVAVAYLRLRTIQVKFEKMIEVSLEDFYIPRKNEFVAKIVIVPKSESTKFEILDVKIGKIKGLSNINCDRFSNPSRQGEIELILRGEIRDPTEFAEIGFRVELKIDDKKIKVNKGLSIGHFKHIDDILKGIDIYGFTI